MGGFTVVEALGTSDAFCGKPDGVTTGGELAEPAGTMLCSEDATGAEVCCAGCGVATLVATPAPVACGTTEPPLGAGGEAWGLLAVTDDSAADVT
jgi:hypothetical protein